METKRDVMDNIIDSLKELLLTVKWTLTNTVSDVVTAISERRLKGDPSPFMDDEEADEWERFWETWPHDIESDSKKN